jgi:hypothetical protein
MFDFHPYIAFRTIPSNLGTIPGWLQLTPPQVITFLVQKEEQNGVASIISPATIVVNLSRSVMDYPNG